MDEVSQILETDCFHVDLTERLLNADKKESELIFEKAAQVKKQFVGNRVYLRGLVEFSNVCQKDCFYCGIRKSNANVERYNLSDKQVVEAAKFAFEKRFGSIVLQSGESESRSFTQRISTLLKKIHLETGNQLQVTLSCGEQSAETYSEWFESGAKRYLLRVETSNPELYRKLHPEDHSHEKRIECLQNLKKTGFQVGTGVMVGLPYQTTRDLANDLHWMKNFDVDMVGMGPYLEHADTPLFNIRHNLLSIQERLDLSLKMIAVLRILMKNINIAASTAMQAADKLGREKAIMVGANVYMPNITPGMYRDQYKLYENKPITNESPDDYISNICARIERTGNKLAFGEWGDSLHYHDKKS